MLGYVGLGSNVGDREEHLRAGLIAMARAGVSPVAVSSLWETEPVDGAGPGELGRTVGEEADGRGLGGALGRTLPPEGLEPREEPCEAEEGREGAGPPPEPREPWLEEGREALPPPWEPRELEPCEEPLEPRWAWSSAALPRTRATSPIQARMRVFMEIPRGSRASAARVSKCDAPAKGPPVGPPDR